MQQDNAQHDLSEALKAQVDKLEQHNFQLKTRETWLTQQLKACKEQLVCHRASSLLGGRPAGRNNQLHQSMLNSQVDDINKELEETKKDLAESYSYCDELLAINKQLRRLLPENGELRAQMYQLGSDLQRAQGCTSYKNKSEMRKVASKQGNVMDGSVVPDDMEDSENDYDDYYYAESDNDSSWGEISIRDQDSLLNSGSDRMPRSTPDHFHPLPTPSPSVSTATIIASPVVEGNTIKRRRDDWEDDNDGQRISKKFRTMSITPSLPDPSKRPTRLAGIAGRHKTGEQFNMIPDFTFTIIASYDPPRQYESKDYQILPNMLKKIQIVQTACETAKGALWMLDEVFHDRNIKPFCLYMKVRGKTTSWRQGNEGKFACNSCVGAKMPCFTYDLHSGRFFILPLHEGDRQVRRVSKETEVRIWIN